MLHKAHPRIQEIRRQRSFITRGMPTTLGEHDHEVRAMTSGSELLDRGQIEGYLKVWGVRDNWGTKFLKGCTARSIRERGPGTNAKVEIKFLWQHRQDDPLGLFEVLEEDAYGLYFRTKKLDDVPSARRALAQIKSRTLNNFSDGFDIIWDSVQYDDTDDSLVVAEEELFEGSVVTLPGNFETYTIRSMADVDALIHDTECFIRSLPRHLQLEAREMFMRHKSLTEFTPEERREARPKASKSGGPVGAINYDYLTKNLKIQ